jgi:hypothetical protein
MERNAVLPKHWNGPSEREHLNTQRRAWSHAKQKDRDDKLTHHDELTAELQILTSQQAESLKLEKSLQAQIQTLRDNPNANLKEEIKALQQQVEAEKEKRRGYKNQRQVINKSIQELKDNGLSGARLHGRRPALSVENKTVGKELFRGPGKLLLCRYLNRILFKKFHIENHMDLSRESVETAFPPGDIHFYEGDTTSLVTPPAVDSETFTAMLNSGQEDNSCHGCGNESTGELFFALFI